MNKLPEYLLLEINKKINKLTCLTFEDRINDLERNLNYAKKDFGFNSLEELYEMILSENISEVNLKKLIKSFTIGETYFFRDTSYLNIIKYYLLTEILKKKDKIKIWCAASSTGEEPYSIAIFLHELIKENYFNNPNIKFEILATDINTDFLNKAKLGIYKDWSFRNKNEVMKSKYFTKQDNGWHLNSYIKDMVDFSYLNLGDNNYPSIKISNIDIVLCRNVLIYFDKIQIKNVINKIYKTISNNGYLILTAIENFSEISETFQPKLYNGFLVHKKNIFNDLDDYTLNFNYENSNEIVQYEFTESKNEVYIPIQNNVINETKESEYDKALKMYNQKNYNKAESTILEYLKNNDPNIDIYKLLIRIYSNKKDSEKAFYWINKAIDKYKMSAELYYYAGILKNEENDLKEAVLYFNKTIYLENDFIMAYFMLGIIAQKNMNKKESNKNFDTVINLLKNKSNEDIIPESDNLSVNNMTHLINSMKVN